MENNYAYANNNPVNANDPTGLDLVPIILPNTQHKDQMFLVDTQAAYAFQHFFSDLQAAGIPVTVNLAFRTTAEQAALYADGANNPNPVAKPGTSFHEGGLAIDINGLGVRPEYKSEANEIAALYGLSPFPGDRPHYSADPAAYGYLSRADSIAKNQAYYNDNTSKLTRDFDFPAASTFGVSDSASGGAAAGGFLLYPNKPNTNGLQEVYRK